MTRIDYLESDIDFNTHYGFGKGNFFGRQAKLGKHNIGIVDYGYGYGYGYDAFIEGHSYGLGRGISIDKKIFYGKGRGYKPDRTLNLFKVGEYEQDRLLVL